jgi:hypothetical protein
MRQRITLPGGIAMRQQGYLDRLASAGVSINLTAEHHDASLCGSVLPPCPPDTFGPRGYALGRGRLLADAHPFGVAI